MKQLKKGKREENYINELDGENNYNSEKKKNQNVDGDVNMNLNDKRNDKINEYHEEMMTDETISMFRDHLFPKPNDRNSREDIDDDEEEEVMMMRSTRCPQPLRPPNFLNCYNIARQPSYLERSIIPGLSPSAAIESSIDGKFSAGQLTIFYAGEVNVYNSVPVYQAKSIMLLAAESSPLKPDALGLPKLNMEKSPHHSSLPKISKLEADFSMARKTSLQNFLEKRRQRIIRKCPYISPNIARQENEPTNDDFKINHNVTLFPFPSRSTSFLPMLGNKSG